MSESPLFKDNYNPQLVETLAQSIQAVYADFPVSSFVAQATANLEQQELKERVASIAAALRDHLPPDYSQAVAILLEILPEENIDTSDGVFANGWYVWPLTHFVEVYGLDHFEQSIHAMHEMTKRWSAEFAIRPYITHYPEQTLAILHQWTEDENEHVRRLVSEGTRPRLPWGGQLRQFMADPTPTLALLEKLKDDPSEYVRRSVANHLNDITKDNPDIALDVLERWAQDADQNRQWIIRHALRSLVKAGDRRALAILGYGEAQVTLHDLKITPSQIHMGESIEISFTLESTADTEQNLMIDYVMHFMKANGKTAPKVFKLTQQTLAPGKSLNVQKKHTIRPVTTRRYYAGIQRVEVQVNGQVIAGGEFELFL